MATITTIDSTDLITNSRTDINTNFSNLNSDKMELSYLDTDTAMAANSDVKVPSQKAVKAYIDTSGGQNASTTVRGIVEEATQAEVDAGTAAGATGARLFINPSTQPSTIPTVQVYTSSSTTKGDTTSQFDITNPVGSTYRYTYDATGTDPSITSGTVPTGIPVLIASTSMNAANIGYFVVTGSGTNYFEVTNASGVVESNKTLAGGYLKTITAQTWTKPTGLKYVIVEVCGAGGAGGYATISGTGSIACGGGGGAGGYAREKLSASALGSTETVYVSPGGGTSGNGTSYMGGSALFGSLNSATGGNGGSQNSSGGTGGVGSGGDININGGGGGGGYGISTNLGGNVIGAGSGGNSYFGAGARGVVSSTGVAGGNYGGGGSGGSVANGSQDGGSGAGGVVIVTEYYHV